MASCTELPPGINKLLEHQLQQLDFAFVISDATAADTPICFASSKFYEMTGYQPSEVIGNNCRFLQGKDTEKRKVMEIRDAIREDRCCQVCLTNYRKDGSAFLNQFFLSPIRDPATGTVSHYVGIQTDITALKDLEAPQHLHEQQAAVVLGHAAGCKMCDVLMQPQEVQQQQQQQQQQAAQQQQPAATDLQEDRAAEASQHDQQPQPQQQTVLDPGSEEDTDVVQQELKQAVDIRSILQQSASAASSSCCMPSSLLQPLMRIQQSFVLADPRLPDCPIIHASQHFLQLTGYSREEVVGRNCRFLQGPGTDQQELDKLRTALTASPPQAVTVTLLNYTKTGQPFYNALHVAPVRDAEGRLEYLIGIQLDITQRDLPATESSSDPPRLQLSHRMAHLGVTGAVRVACRGLSGHAGGLRRSIDHQGLPHRGYAHRLSHDGGSSSSSSKHGDGVVADEYGMQLRRD